MKKTAIALLLLSVTFAFSQNKESANRLIEEGISYHDKGDFQEAINKYNKALEVDKDNVFALAEKALSLLSLKKVDESIVVCKQAIEKHPKENSLKTVYVTYGNALDALNKADKAIEIYDEGLKVFPEYYQLHFNKGITYANIKKYDEAISCFQKAILINPKHAGSNNAIARLEKMNDRRIPAILSFCRFLITEPQTARAKENLKSLKELMTANVEKTGENAVTVNVNSKMLSERTGKPKENDFSSTDLVSTMDIALDFDEKNKNKTEVENFIRKFETICASLSEMKKNNFGFYWDVYAPYFIEMKNNKLLEPFAYIVYASSGTKDVDDWIKNNDKELDKFYDWSSKYNWKN